MTDAVQRFGITGTDTGIGKTIVACALAARARELALRVAVMKPVESGIAERRHGDASDAEAAVISDAELLRSAAGMDVPLSVIRPYVLEEPLAPMIAAQRAGVYIDLQLLDDARATLEANADVLLIEGAGGLMVPISATHSYLDLFVRWQSPLVIVAGNRLGVLNHVLLTVHAARTAGLEVRAVVLTDLSPRPATVAEATNFDALAQLLPQIPLFRFPWVHAPTRTDALAAAAAGSGLDALLSRVLVSPASPLPSA